MIVAHEQKPGAAGARLGDSDGVDEERKRRAEGEKKQKSEREGVVWGKKRDKRMYRLVLCVRGKWGHNEKNHMYTWKIMSHRVQPSPRRDWAWSPTPKVVKRPPESRKAMHASGSRRGKRGPGCRRRAMYVPGPRLEGHVRFEGKRTIAQGEKMVLNVWV